MPENQNGYFCICCICKKQFEGRKRDVICPSCKKTTIKNCNNCVFLNQAKSPCLECEQFNKHLTLEQILAERTSLKQLPPSGIPMIELCESCEHVDTPSYSEPCMSCTVVKTRSAWKPRHE